MFKIRVERVLHKNIEEVFEAISDHANYKLFPGISGSKLVEVGKTENNGNGALREIVAGPFTLIERITSFNRPTLMNYHIEKTSPLPMRHDKGEITLQALDDKSRVIWVSEGHINIPLVGSALDKVIEYKIAKAFGAILSYIDKN